MITTLKLKKILTGILSLLLMSGAYSQQTSDNNPYILFTGLVLTADSLQPIPYVSIKNNRRGMIGYTNEYGHFDVIVKKGDTIWFNQVEKVASWHIIPDTLTQSRYHVVKLLTQDTINLPVIYIRALPLKTLFDYEFVNGDIPDDAYERARQNLEAEALKEQMKLKPADAKESQSLLAQTRASQLYYYKQAPPQNYLNHKKTL